MSSEPGQAKVSTRFKHLPEGERVGERESRGERAWRGRVVVVLYLVDTLSTKCLLSRLQSSLSPICEWICLCRYVPALISK